MGVPHHMYRVGTNVCPVVLRSIYTPRIRHDTCVPCHAYKHVPHRIRQGIYIWIIKWFIFILFNLISWDILVFIIDFLVKASALLFNELFFHYITLTHTWATPIHLWIINNSPIRICAVECPPSPDVQDVVSSSVNLSCIFIPFLI